MSIRKSSLEQVKNGYCPDVTAALESSFPVLNERTCPVLLRPFARIRDGVAEEVEEEGLGEGVELGEGGAALGPQRLRPVQHLRNPPLLRQRGQGDATSSDRKFGNARLIAPRKSSWMAFCPRADGSDKHTPAMSFARISTSRSVFNYCGVIDEVLATTCYAS